MAQRRSLFDAVATPATPMTPSGGSQQMYDPNTPSPMLPVESPDTFRRRTTPLVGDPPPHRSQIEEVLALIRGGQ